MATDDRLMLIQDLELLANQRGLFAQLRYTAEERARWVQEVVRACEAIEMLLPPTADALQARARWLIATYQRRAERPLTAAQRRVWADRAAKTLRAAAEALNDGISAPRGYDFFVAYNEQFHAGQRMVTDKGRGGGAPPPRQPAEHEKGDPRSGWRKGRQNTSRD